MREGEEKSLIKLAAEMVHRSLGGRKHLQMIYAYNRLFDLDILDRLYKFRFECQDGSTYQCIVGISKSNTVVTDMKTCICDSSKIYLSEYNVVRLAAEEAINKTDESDEIKKKMLDSLYEEFTCVLRTYIADYITRVKRKYYSVNNPHVYSYRCFMLIRKLTRVISDFDIDDFMFTYGESDFYYNFVFIYKGKELFTYKICKTAKIDRFLD